MLGIVGRVPAFLQFDLLSLPPEILFGGDALPGEPLLPLFNPSQSCQGFGTAAKLHDLLPDGFVRAVGTQECPECFSQGRRSRCFVAGNAFGSPPSEPVG